MKTFLLFAALLISVASTACDKLPENLVGPTGPTGAGPTAETLGTSPATASGQTGALYAAPEGEPINGLPVSINLPGYDGRIGFVCATKPRSYCDGKTCTVETDYYLQLQECPKELIN